MSGHQHAEPLRHFDTDEFTLRLDGERWGLYMEGLRYFWFDESLAQATEGYTAEEVALMIFDKILEVHCNAAQIGFERGAEAAQEKIRQAIGMK